jgi:membrane-bound serine protease (ClpP class)
MCHNHFPPREPAMPTPTHTLIPRRNAARRAGVACEVLTALLFLVLSPSLVFAEGSPDRGYILKVPSALDTRWIDSQKKAIDMRLARFDKERHESARFKLICDFNPDNHPSACDDFHACDKLADYLVELRNRNVRTVAYIHDEVTRHSVLPVLACEEIVFADRPIGSGERQRVPALGRVSSPDRELREKERSSYEKIVAGRWAPVIVQKMYDSNLVVVKKRGGGYDDKKQAPNGEEIPELGRNTVALYRFDDAVKYGLCQKSALNSMNDVLANYGLSSSSQFDDPDQTVVAWRVDVAGEMNGGLRERIERRIRRAVEGGKANVLILQLECHGGDYGEAQRLGQFVLDLNNKDRKDRVRTIAYVTPQAADTAAYIAFACNEMVFHPDAKLDFDTYVKSQPKYEGAIREALVDVARQGVHPTVIAEGMLSRSLRILLVVNRNGDSRRKYMSETEYEEDQKSAKPEWNSIETVKPPSNRKEDQDRYLVLTADSARKLGLCAEDGVVRSYEELCGQQGLDSTAVKVADSDWLDALADFLRHPWTSVVLVMIGITCLILELKMPGVSLPGVLAAICFVLFFWSHSGFNQIGVLAMLLFALGLLLVLLELFVLPGFAVPGVSGILLMLCSVGLVAYGHWPHSSSEWIDFGQHLKWYSISIFGACVSAYCLAKYLPNVPYANRLFLKPPGTASDDGDGEHVDLLRPELAALLGAIGVAATPLRPAGKVQFGEQFVDVVAESGYVQPGTRVQVVEIEGMRVVVKEV